MVKYHNPVAKAQGKAWLRRRNRLNLKDLPHSNHDSALLLDGKIGRLLKSALNVM